MDESPAEVLGRWVVLGVIAELGRFAGLAARGLCATGAAVIGAVAALGDESPLIAGVRSACPAADDVDGLRGDFDGGDHTASRTRNFI